MNDPFCILVIEGGVLQAAYGNVKLFLIDHDDIDDGGEPGEFPVEPIDGTPEEFMEQWQRENEHE